MIQQLRYLIADLKRWKCQSYKDLFYFALEQGIWGTIFFRISRAFFLINIPILKILFRFIGFLFFKFSETFLGVAIRPGADIGPGLYIGHAGLVMIHAQCKIGKNLSVGTGVLIGQRGQGHIGVPALGDHVYIGVGAKLLGNIRIGNKVNIGANAVVVKDVPDNTTVVGIPARAVEIRKRDKDGA